jgi:hypothetical protein
LVLQAIRTALKKLEEGGNIEDAKAVCEPEVLSQILKWKDKLKVYLAPFLHGARYTSFGRHFTNPEKLQQIVDRLHWYADDGDMVRFAHKRYLLGLILLFCLPLLSFFLIF